ncbi:MAG: hypothetical protein ACK553_10000 [Planctomycetota bacterium]|jgi:hypothetical protein
MSWSGCTASRCEYAIGVLVGLVIVLMVLPQATALQAARAIGLFTLAIGYGGILPRRAKTSSSFNP